MNMDIQEFRNDLLAKTTDLIEEHLDYLQIEQKKLDEEITLIEGYRQAEEKLLAYIETQIVDVRNLNDLVGFFFHTCSAFNALGNRVNLIGEKLLGPYRSEVEILEDTINKDIPTHKDNPWFGDCSYIPLEYEYHFCGYGPTSSDEKALAAMVLIDTFLKGNYEALSLASAISSLVGESCLKPLFDMKQWAEPLVGFYDKEYTYIPTVNQKFVGMFSSALQALLSKENSLKSLQIKQYLHELVVVAWSDSPFCQVMEIYQEIEELLVASRSVQGITRYTVDRLMYCKDLAIKKVYGLNEVVYQIDKEGLDKLIAMLKMFKVNDLQIASRFIELLDSIDG